MSTKSVDGTVAIVTGGGRGLGRAMVLGLAEAGARVVATAARERGEIESVASEAGPDRVLPLLADVADPADCGRVVQAARERFLEQPTRFWETDPDVWRMVIDSNVNGPFFMTRAAVPVMLEQGWGRVLNVSMNHATMRRRGFSPYGPSKAALESETIIWAQDLQGTGVTVNALLPGGPTLTGMIPDGVPDAIRRGLLPPEVMVPPLLWLASRAADGVTGRRFNASAWQPDRDDDANVAAITEVAGWTGER
ncbi:MAG TPA: SDR family oxidoreductase [Gammaproteobacteria bacterium]|nr:SDR family oxidoreductase [Gammaproteobacteria bacterium]